MFLEGIPNLITADMIKEGAAVIDVGINRIQDPLTGKDRLVGDVDFEGKDGRKWNWKKSVPISATHLSGVCRGVSALFLTLRFSETITRVVLSDKSQTLTDISILT